MLEAFEHFLKIMLEKFYNAFNERILKYTQTNLVFYKKTVELNLL